MKNFDLSAVGFVVLDTLCTPAEVMPPAGGATFVYQMTMTVAGTAGATGYDCALMGLSVRIATELGQDPMGDWLENEMRAAGMDVSLVSRNPNVQTPMSMLPIGSDGERRAFFAPGTSETFSLSSDEMDSACDARILHLGGTGLLKTFDGDRSLELLKRAKQKGCTTFFDLILADRDTVELVEPLLPYIDYFVPSIQEAGVMAGQRDTSDIAAWFKERGVGNVILTLGSKGVWLETRDGERCSLQALDVDVVDTTGCGDSFTAGMIAGVSKGWDIYRAAGFANSLAAQVASGLGSQGGKRDFSQLSKEWELLAE